MDPTLVPQDTCALPGSRDEDDSFHFEPQEAPHVPRAWERVPRTPVAPGRKGRKIYKRQTDIGGNGVGVGSQEEPDRGAKRQCLNNLPAVPAQLSKRPQYALTLREQRPGTPRRERLPP
ncbi:MAG: hypothetical protein LQ340_006592, partial [Diploschistes diacapsis]